MADNKPLRILRLDNGLILEICDRSNRYFGDYHRICLEIRSRLPLRPEFFAAEADAPSACRRAQQVLGDTPEELRILERMGVAGREREAVRDAMIESFLSANLVYLRRPEYPARFLARQLQEQKRRRLPRLVTQ